MTHAKKRLLVVLGVLVIGFALRFGLAIVQGISTPPEATSDQEEYDAYAWNLAQGRGYRGMSPDVADRDHLTAYRSPGTSVVWAGLYVVFGHRYDVVRVMHCLVGALSILLLYGIGRRCFGDRVALLAAAVYAVFPTSVFYTVDLLSEPLGTFWLLAYVLASLWFADRPTWGRAGVAGLLLGAAMLTRPGTVVMLPLAGVWALWQFRWRWREMLPGVAIPALAVATLVPWTVRNYVRFNAFIPLSTMGGSALLQGNNRIVITEPESYGYAVWDTKIPEYKEALQAANDEVERDRIAKEFAIRWLKDNPDQWGFLVVAKLWRGLTPVLQSNSPPAYRLAMLFSWGPVLVLFVAAFVPTLVRFLRTRHPGWLVHLCIGHFLITTVIFFGYARYRSVVEPLCILLAAQAILFCLTRAGVIGTSAGQRSD